MTDQEYQKLIAQMAATIYAGGKVDYANKWGGDKAVQEEAIHIAAAIAKEVIKKGV